MVDFDRKLEATSSEMQDLRSKLKLAQKEVSHEIQTSINSNRGHDFQAINTETGDLDQEIQKLASISLTSCSLNISNWNITSLSPVQSLKVWRRRLNNRK
ncbi:hypothetical protein KSP39_PZI016184 [Platanthera zijinensis]|uniref:Uncharacterized protein n=1 Tax=Platanthera zijinensis TaxID=2320716 RepID=A0AAP0B7X0_9ASPA